MNFRRREFKVPACRTHLGPTALCPLHALMCSFVITACHRALQLFFPHWRSGPLGPCSQTSFVSNCHWVSWLRLPAWAPGASTGDSRPTPDGAAPAPRPITCPPTSEGIWLLAEQPRASVLSAEAAVSVVYGS